LASITLLMLIEGGKNMKKITRALIGMGTAVAAVAITASPAQASVSNVVVTKVCSLCPEAGHMTFMADPHTRAPGDSIQVCDIQSDGWGIEGYLYYNGVIIRTADTRGHNAKYCTSWKSGNLPEDHSVTLKVCMVKGSETKNCYLDYAES
jgi:hypothetical protein